MLFVPTALILADRAQNRHLAGSRLDGPVIAGSHRRWFRRPALFAGATATGDARGRRLTPRPA